jgi:hypothetical protein
MMFLVITGKNTKIQPHTPKQTYINPHITRPRKGDSSS